EDSSWAIYDCLHTELRYDDTIYILSIGQWFPIEQNFVEEIDSFIESVADCHLEFPEIDGEHEKDANEIFEASLPNLINLDRNNASLEQRYYVKINFQKPCPLEGGVTQKRQ